MKGMGLMSHSNRASILLVEDDEPKLKSIMEFLQEHLPKDVEILTASSLSSAIRALSRQRVDLALIDMSLPTFDLAIDQSGGGHPQGFGGADILRFIETEVPETRSLVITQYEEFPSESAGFTRDIRWLEQELKSELGERFQGVIHYAGRQGAWREALAEHLTAIFGERYS